MAKYIDTTQATTHADIWTLLLEDMLGAMSTDIDHHRTRLDLLDGVLTVCLGLTTINCVRSKRFDLSQSASKPSPGAFDMLRGNEATATHTHQAESESVPSLRFMSITICVINYSFNCSCTFHAHWSCLMLLPT